MNEQRLFEYDELLAMCLLCAAKTALIIVEQSFADEKEGRKLIESEVKEIIAIRWDHPSKG